ncbi:hypothetical protein [uncultured Methanolobus sp.]|uniref:hypothetical protein n=1 Tax=uncultured Methanolobus sp. TaxID=218300 RepID=UPI002AABBB7B|nr:hypothetical protein [uncultured Methanolobus sp.]
MILPPGIEIPNNADISKACAEFETCETRDVMYKVAMSHMKSHWEEPEGMTDAIGVLLLSWNQQFYRFHKGLNLKRVEDCIIDNMDNLKEFNNRTITSLSNKDDENIKKLFNELNNALQGDDGVKSAVSTVKALHLLAPNFFPLWDAVIAKKYRVYYSNNPDDKYLLFCKYSQIIHEHIKHYKFPSEKSILKIIDEYNYSKFTKNWI